MIIITERLKDIFKEASDFIRKTKKNKEML